MQNDSDLVFIGTDLNGMVVFRVDARDGTGYSQLLMNAKAAYDMADRLRKAAESITPHAPTQEGR